MTNVTSKASHLISLTSDSVAAIDDLSFSGFNGPVLGSENSQLTIDRLSIRKLQNRVEGMAIFDFSHSKVVLNNSFIQDI